MRQGDQSVSANIELVAFLLYDKDIRKCFV